MASEVCIRTHHLAPVWLSHSTICAQTQLKGDKARDGRASHHLSALSGANALLSPVYWRLFIVIHHAIARLRGPYHGQTKGLVAGGCVQTNVLKVGLGMNSLLCTHPFVWQQTVKVPAGPRPLAISAVPFRGEASAGSPLQ